jgi:hypothetical protein
MPFGPPRAPPDAQAPVGCCGDMWDVEKAWLVASAEPDGPGHPAHSAICKVEQLSSDGTPACKNRSAFQVGILVPQCKLMSFCMLIFGFRSARASADVHMSAWHQASSKKPFTNVSVYETTAASWSVPLDWKQPISLYRTARADLGRWTDRGRIKRLVGLGFSERFLEQVRTDG